MSLKKGIYALVFLFVSLLLACAPQQSSAPATLSPAQATPVISTALPATTEAPTDTPTVVPSQTPTSIPTETPTATATAPAGISFLNDVLPILKSRCVNCHGGERVEEGLLLRTYEELMAGSANGPVIVPGDPENSLLVQLIVNQKMPKRGPKLTPQQVEIIIEWVRQGAPNN
ncbi:MAG: c-type cytochrome domain-containing protein [Anaerolineales bacterium]